MNTEGFYRRPLPDGLVAFSAPRGRELFQEALASGGMEGYFSLAEQFHTQAEPAFCGLGTLVVVLNALSIDPGRLWKGPWRWYSEEMLDCCLPLPVVKEKGLTLGQFSCLARCNGARIERRWAERCDVDTFRRDLKMATAGSSGPHLVINYSRRALGQTGDGHFSPIGGYHEALDMALILDVARFKYPPHWVPVPLLWEAMQLPDPATGRSRGYLLMSRGQVPGATLCHVSGERSSWDEIIRQLEEVIPRALEAEQPRSIEEAVQVFVDHLAPDLFQAMTILSDHVSGAFQDEHKVAVQRLLEEIRQSELFGLVGQALHVHKDTGSAIGEWLDHQPLATELTAVLLLTCAGVMEAHAPESVRELFERRLTLDGLPLQLREEVMKVRSQFQAMRDYCCARGGVD